MSRLVSCAYGALRKRRINSITIDSILLYTYAVSDAIEYDDVYLIKNMIDAPNYTTPTLLRIIAVAAALNSYKIAKYIIEKHGADHYCVDYINEAAIVRGEPNIVDFISDYRGRFGVNGRRIGDLYEYAASCERRDVCDFIRLCADTIVCMM